VTATQVPPSAIFVQLPDRPLTLDDVTELAANERDGPATVHLYRLGLDERGEPAYIGHRAILLDELLDAEPPALG